MSDTFKDPVRSKTALPRILVAGLKGGSGKTTLSLGLIAAFRERGMKVVPFKKGPDYIDAGWLSAAAGNPCYNLDPFMIGSEQILASFRSHFDGADCAVIEGNRGLYDGMDAEGTYSTAELAKILRCPVVLILDCTKMTRTAAAIVLGAKKFDPRVALRGVVLNRIAGARHEKVIRDSIAQYCDIEVLGAIPKLGREFVQERHMGLTPSQEHPEVAGTIGAAREIALKYVDIDRLAEIARQSRPAGNRRSPEASPGVAITGLTARPVRIGIVRDSAFQFYYPENFETLEAMGAELVPVSALTASCLPDIDALYIGGGFPETHAIALSKNVRFRKSLRKAVEDGLPVYAECGGLMYLGKELMLEGLHYPMTGIFPLTFGLEKKPHAHGYTELRVTRKNAFYRRGTVLKGHEFHYSKPQCRSAVSFSFAMTRGHGILDKEDGITYRNVLATYTHLHAYGSPEWAEGMIRAAKAYRKLRNQHAQG